MGARAWPLVGGRVSGSKGGQCDGRSGLGGACLSAWGAEGVGRVGAHKQALFTCLCGICECYLRGGVLPLE